LLAGMTASYGLRLLLILPVSAVVPILPLFAQTLVTGSVLAADSSPVRGGRVVLHRVGRGTEGPVDSTRSDQRGRFRFVIHPDTGSLYLLSTRYAGIEYFSPPISPNIARPDTGVRIVVYDTSSSAPVALAARHVVLTRPGTDGSRAVLELLVLRNAGRLTRVTSDTLQPSWSMALPRDVIGFRVGESDVSAEAIAVRRDSLIVSAPLAPGEKELTIQYQVAAGTRVLQLPNGQPGVTMNVLVEERGVSVEAPGLVLADSQVIQGRSFQRWTGVVPRGTIRLSLPSTQPVARWLLPVLVAGLAVGLIGAGWYFARRSGRKARMTPDELLDRIATLDARFLGHEPDISGQEWSWYQVERARLKTELEAALAAGGWNR
jgi:hypothetical protein